MAKTIPQLTDATTVNAADELIIQQGGITKRATATELAKGLNTINGTVNVKDFGAVGDGVTDDSAAISAAATVAQELNCPVKVPAGTFYINSTVSTMAETAQEGQIRFGASGSYSDASHRGQATVRLSPFLKRYADQADALEAAVKCLFNGSGANTSPTSNALVLDCEGIEVRISRPLEFTTNEIATGSGFLRNHKTITNLNLVADSSNWSGGAGASLFTIRGDQLIGNLRNFSLVECRFDCANISNLHGLTVGGYYALFVRNCSFRRFQNDAIRSLGYGDSTGNHGLVVEGCNITGDFNSSEGKRGVFTQDGDVVVRGCMIEWVERGVVSTRGSIKIEHNHFSMGNADSVPCIEINAPRGVSIIDNDIDGAHIWLNNNTLNTFNNEYFQGWNSVTITGNDFVLGANNTLDGSRGLITFETSTANNYVGGLTVFGNYMIAHGAKEVSSIVISGGVATVTTVDDHKWSNFNRVTIAGASPDQVNGLKTITVTGSKTFTFTTSATGSVTGTVTAKLKVDAIRFLTTGVGSWSDNFVAIVNQARSGNIDVGTFPAINRLASDDNFSIETSATNLVLSSVSGTPAVLFSDSTNNGTNMPRVQSSGETLQLRVQNSGTVRSAMLVNDGTFRPNSDNLQTLGNGTYRWSVVHAGTGTISTSDQNEKQQIQNLSDAEKNAAAELKVRIKKFKFNNAVAKKGDLARTHVGVLAQDVLDVFEANGLNAHNYGLFCLDEWEEVPEIKDADGLVVQDHIPAGSRLGVRYDELLAFIIASI